MASYKTALTLRPNRDINLPPPDWELIYNWEPRGTGWVYYNWDIDDFFPSYEKDPCSAMSDNFKRYYKYEMDYWNDTELPGYWTHIWSKSNGTGCQFSTSYQAVSGSPPWQSYLLNKDYIWAGNNYLYGLNHPIAPSTLKIWRSTTGLSPDKVPYKWSSAVPYGTSETEHYTCIDEEILDTSDYIITNEPYGDTDTFGFQSHTVENENIARIHIKINATYSTGGALLNIIINGTEMTAQSMTYNGYYCWDVYTNPLTNLPWTWTEIDNLEIGIKGIVGAASWIKVFQTFVEVDVYQKRKKIYTIFLESQKRKKIYTIFLESKKKAHMSYIMRRK
jgi:hypothetical protein